MQHRTLEELEAGVAHVAAAPRDHGTLEMIVLRPQVDQRTTPGEATLTVDGGVEGDGWPVRGSRHTEDGSANPEQQVAVINSRYLDLIAGGRDRWPLAGDQLVADLDLSQESLRPGDQLQLGEAVVEVTPHPHRGCAKFRDRFGPAAVQFANGPVGTPLRLRGLYVRVVVGGAVRVGDTVSRVEVPAVVRG